MSPLELFTNNHETRKPSPEQIQEMVRLKKELDDKLVQIDKNMAIIDPERANEYYKHMGDREKLGEIASSFSQALSPENLQNMYGKAEEPEESPVAHEEKNTYNNYLEDSHQLGEMVGGFAQALSPENLQKVYGKTEEVTVEPVVTKPIPAVEENTYAKHLEDNKKLAEVMGDAAQALSQENLQKMYAQTEESKEIPVAKTLEVTNPPAAGHAADQESAPIITSKTTDAAVLEDPAITPPGPSPTLDQPSNPGEKTKAQLLAEKIRNLDKTGETLSAEDFEFRTTHWSEVSKALADLSQPSPINHETTIERGKPSLEWLTLSYGEALFQNKEVLKHGFDAADPLVRDHLKNLSEEYHEAHFAEVKKIHEAKGSIADQLAFYKQQSEKLAQEIMKRENAEMKQRVEKVISKTATAVGRGALYTFVLGAELVKGAWKKTGDLAQQGFQKIKAAWNAPKSDPRTLKEKLLEKFQMNKKPLSGMVPDAPEKQTPGLSTKFGKTKQQVLNQRLETLEKILGGTLEGDRKKKWERLGEISIVGFFNPVTKLNKKLEDYPEDARKIYDSIKPYYMKDLVSDPKMKLKDYIIQLVKNNELKDLWNQPSPSNS